MDNKKPKITFTLRFNWKRDPGEKAWGFKTDLNQTTPLEGETQAEARERLELLRQFSRPEVRLGLLLLLGIVVFIGSAICMLIGQVVR